MTKIEQINREYKLKALQLHPDKNPDPSSLEKFRQIQAAKDVLSDESTRRSYDCWLNCRINIPFEQWQAKKGHSMHWATPNKKLSIRQETRPRQGSDLHTQDERISCVGGEESWLEKFRKYEI